MFLWLLDWTLIMSDEKNTGPRSMSPNQVIQSKIITLEALSLRAIREALIDGSLFPVVTQAQYKLQDIDTEITGLRAQLTPEK